MQKTKQTGVPGGNGGHSVVGESFSGGFGKGESPQGEVGGAGFRFDPLQCTAIGGSGLHDKGPRGNSESAPPDN